MINFLRKFGVYEYIFAVIGLTVLLKLTISFWNDTLENTALNGIAFIAGVLLLAAPRFLVRQIKERAAKIKK